MIRQFALGAAALLCAASASLARPQDKSQADLKVGDAAPALTVEKWVKGAPVASFEKGKVYVIEFWATWCGPCIASMPHITKLQAQYKDKGLTVIGMTSEDKSNSLEKVEKMVAEKGDGMGYSVAWDKGQATHDAFMKAARQNGIPCSFLIDGQGRVAYIGHPMTLDVPLKMVVAGTWDTVKGPAMLGEVSSLRKEAARLAKSDPKGALAKLDELEKKFPDFAGTHDSMRFDLLLQAKDTKGAWAVATRLVDEAVADKNATGLNEVAWKIVDPATELAERNLELALRAAQKGVELTSEKDAALLDTLARVWAWKGDYKKALETEQKAAALNDERFKEDIEKALAEYKEKLK